MDLAAGVSELGPLLVKRLSVDAAEGTRIATAYLEAVVEQAVVNTRSQTVGPTALATSRVQLVELLAARLGRLPTSRELTALLRITETAARSLLRNVLSISDRVNDIALKSIFARAQRDGRLGSGGDPPRAVKWKMKDSGDLEFARDLLAARGIAFRTIEDEDADHILAVEPRFKPETL